MELLTKKETDVIYNEVTLFGKRKMTSNRFNEAVNKLLMDPEILKALMKRVKDIKDKLS